MQAMKTGSTGCAGRPLAKQHQHFQQTLFHTCQASFDGGGSLQKLVHTTTQCFNCKGGTRRRRRRTNGIGWRLAGRLRELQLQLRLGGPGSCGSCDSRLVPGWRLLLHGRRLLLSLMLGQRHSLPGTRLLQWEPRRRLRPNPLPFLLMPPELLDVPNAVHVVLVGNFVAMPTVPLIPLVLLVVAPVAGCPFVRDPHAQWH